MEGTPQQGYQSRFTPQEVYRIAIREINQHCKAGFDRPFAQLASDRQLRLLEQLEKDEIALPSLSSKFFFDMLWRNTEEGYFADPLYGGNRDKVGWKLLGFPGVPSGEYRQLVTSHEPYYAEPVSVLDVQPARCRSMRKAFQSTSSSSATATRNAEMSATNLKSVDVVVVGSGVVGSIMSMELASAGLSVVCLERGKQFDINTDFQKPTCTTN
jgi:gluconate 2-dehydrogenase subunit 3-like protein/FAD binding domain-containing protein